MEIIKSILNTTLALKQAYLPVLFRLSGADDRGMLTALFASGAIAFVHDEIMGQLKELIKAKYPSRKIATDEYEVLIDQHLNGVPVDEYGVWVYYPWSKTLVHILDEEEFVQLRTNRNQYKITAAEQKLLQSKKIAIIGLSVGQSIALTLATERVCGELRLADFDDLELSNLNRIRAGIRSLGLSKVVIAAREIAEIDPFLKVIIYPEGITKENMDAFLTANGKVDILVEVCDGLDIKVNCRYKARAYGIPVVMDTNDRGMLDVERFDLEPERAILHGLADGLNPDNIKSLTNEEKIPFILKMIGVDTLSTRLKASMMEVEQSINTWPQVASSVVLGGALTTDVCRRILLNQFNDSGRYYVDFDDLISEEGKVLSLSNRTTPANPYQAVSASSRLEHIQQYLDDKKADAFSISNHQLERLMAAAIAAPSAGNNQPWSFVFKGGVLFLFHEPIRSWSWGDPFHLGAMISMGAVLENIHLQSLKLNLSDQVAMLPLNGAPELIAAIHFSELQTPASPELSQIAEYIFERHTNRKLGIRQILPPEQYQNLMQLAEGFQGVKLCFTENEDAIRRLGEIIAECDKIRLLNEQGHKEFYAEVRWNKEEAEQRRDGIELRAVDLSPSEIAGFSVGKDWKAMSLLAEWKGGNGLKKMSVKSVRSASSMLLLTLPDISEQGLLYAGRALERMWIYACKEKISVHPMLSPIFFFDKLNRNQSGFTSDHMDILEKLQAEFNQIFGISGSMQRPVFLLKLSVADEIDVPSLRRDIKEVFMNYDF